MKNLNLVCRHTMYNSLRQLTYLAFPSHLLVRELLPSTCYVHSSVLYTGRQADRQAGRTLQSMCQVCFADSWQTPSQQGKGLHSIWHCCCGRSPGPGAMSESYGLTVLTDGRLKGQGSKHMECPCWETGHGRQFTARTKDGPCHLLIEGLSQKPRPMCHIQKKSILRSFYTSLYQSS